MIARAVPLALGLALAGCHTELTANECIECHTSPVAKNHMQTNGGSFDTASGRWTAPVPKEACIRCHGAERPVDVEKAHALRRR